MISETLLEDLKTLISLNTKLIEKWHFNRNASDKSKENIDLIMELLFSEVNRISNKLKKKSH